MPLPWSPFAVRRAFAVAAVALSACRDPVQRSEVDALGGETPGVSPGPFHRPGQPCLECHDGAIGDPEAFSVAGTVYQTPSSAVGSEGVVVHLVDSTGTPWNETTNRAGNFYIKASDWGPTFPIVATIQAPGASVVAMQSRIGREGACNWCHTAPAGQASPGHVVLETDDGGVPP